MLRLLFAGDEPFIGLLGYDAGLAITWKHDLAGWWSGGCGDRLPPLPHGWCLQEEVQ